MIICITIVYDDLVAKVNLVDNSGIASKVR